MGIGHGWQKPILLLTMAPETRSKSCRVTCSSAASALAKKKGDTESVAGAKMPPKRKVREPMKVARKRRVAKGKRTGMATEDGKEGLCPEGSEAGWYGEMCDNCDSEALCIISMNESMPLDCYSSDSKW
jgi:hypothetical protein